ncbi:DNA polymerase/3'-5' exonuclease PolX [Aureibacillus halotolerans]|uniref:DNA polymerase (Family 10) n=1 Tax=Aureibacillus halotolerans TaxID=1508390 RepID=A0A4R6U7Y7_9BACI|nr:DNA polymerase/3'-5' exonuclease PolX [Aureibacillus halotolerans]TDQ39174.1 DNA polymerase (family 10) [Aureibacillus halotolerans]
MNKKDIIHVLETIALLLEIKGENGFKVSAYRKAAVALEDEERSLAEIEDPGALKGIGKGTAQVIDDLIQLGHSPLLEELQQSVPEGLPPLLDLPGLGGKKIAKLHQELGVHDAPSLKAACEQQKVSSLAGFGAKTEANILRALEERDQGPQRHSYASVRSLVKEFAEVVKAIPDVERVEVGGSFRRVEETVKDLDFVVATSRPAMVSQALTSLSLAEEVIVAGDTKVTLRLKKPSIQVDVRLVSSDQFASTLHHFTGSKEHNVKLRQLAKERGEKISEYGIETATGIVTPETEQAFYDHFGLPMMSPELREGKKEFTHQNELSTLVRLEDIQGDLHMHTTWSDGAYSVKEMALAAKEKGYSYIVITDHSKYLRVARGLTVEQIRRQREEIDRVNDEIDGIHLFKGTDMDILPDGTLDYEDDVLKGLDFVIASIHSSFSQSSDKLMMRLETALKNEHVHMIAHPTGRLVGKREGYQVDVDALIHVAAETQTVLELNGNPMRFDLAPYWLEKAKRAGVQMAVSTDAHNIDMLADMAVGVKTARKAFLTKEDLLNTTSLQAFKEWLKVH